MVTRSGNLLKISRLIDAVTKNRFIANWLVLIACVISAANALMRYGFSLSSNAWLEIQCTCSPAW